MSFSANLTLLIKKISFFTSFQKNWIFFLRKYQYGYLNESYLDELNTCFSNKIHWRSISTLIRKILNKRYIYIYFIYVPFLCTKRSPVDFWYWKTYSARQDGSFKYPYCYFQRKKIQFLLKGVKKVKYFSINNVKFA